MRRAAWEAQRGVGAAGSRVRGCRTRRGRGLRGCASLAAGARRGGACVGRQRTRERWLSEEERVASEESFLWLISGFYFTETPRLPRGWLRSTSLPDDRLRFLLHDLGADCGIATALRTHCRYCSFCAGARHTGAPEALAAANFATAGEAPQPTPCCVAHHSSCHPQHADGAMVCAAFLYARRHQHRAHTVSDAWMQHRSSPCWCAPHFAACSRLAARK